MQALRCFGLYFLALLFFMCAWGIQANAQSIDDLMPPQLISDPLYPEPESTVTISLDAYYMNTTGATIVWKVDGTERGEFRNNRSIEVSSGALGKKQTITATVQLPGQSPFTATYVLRPSAIDIILESNTYIPTFFKGRSLPSESAVVRAIAIPHLVPSVPLSSLTFEWKQGATVLFGGPVRGKYAAEVTLSRYAGDYLSVSILDAQGNSVGSRSILLDPHPLELHFYEENPLRGLSSKALGEEFFLIGDETTIHAEPYYMNSDLTRGSSQFNWRVDGTIANGEEYDHTITLRRNGAGGSTLIELIALTTTTIPQYVQRSLSIIF